MNSNTSGTDVANVGFWPRGLLQRVADMLGSAATQLRSVIAGTSNIATVDFIKQAASDAIADDRLAEIARRLIVTIENQNQGTVVFSATEPTDKTKVWWKTDATTNLPVGVPLIWDDPSQKWIAIISQQASSAPDISIPERRTTQVFTDAGQSVKDINFTDIGTTDFMVKLTPTTFYNNTWNALGTAPAGHFSWVVTNKTSNQVTVQFYAVPHGGLTFDVEVTENET